MEFTYQHLKDIRPTEMMAQCCESDMYYALLMNSVKVCAGDFEDEGFWEAINDLKAMVTLSSNKLDEKKKSKSSPVKTYTRR